MEHQHPAPAKKPSPKRPQSKQPSSRTLRANAFLEQLSKKYPMVFDRENPIPLALGIHRSIRGAIESGQIECSSPSITYVALRSWTRRTPYIRTLVKGGERFHLRGEPEGESSEEHTSKLQELLRISNAVF